MVDLLKNKKKKHVALGIVASRLNMTKCKAMSMCRGDLANACATGCLIASELSEVSVPDNLLTATDAEKDACIKSILKCREYAEKMLEREKKTKGVRSLAAKR